MDKKIAKLCEIRNDRIKREKCWRIRQISMETFLSSEFLAIFSFLFFVIKFLVLNQRNLKATKLYYVISNGLLFSNLVSKVLLATSTTTIKPFLFKNYSIFLCVSWRSLNFNTMLSYRTYQISQKLQTTLPTWHTLIELH